MINLENLLDGSISDRNFQALARLVVDTGGQSINIRCGTDTWTFPGGSARSNVKVTSHGLGRTPIAVFVCGAQLNGLNETVAGETGTWTTTQFSSQAGFVQGFAPGAGATLGFSWVAIG